MPSGNSGFCGAEARAETVQSRNKQHLDKQSNQIYRESTALDPLKFCSICAKNDYIAIVHLCHKVQINMKLYLMAKRISILQIKSSIKIQLNHTKNKSVGVSVYPNSSPMLNLKHYFTSGHKRARMENRLYYCLLQIFYSS